MSLGHHTSGSYMGTGRISFVFYSFVIKAKLNGADHFDMAHILEDIMVLFILLILEGNSQSEELSL